MARWRRRGGRLVEPGSEDGVTPGAAGEGRRCGECDLCCRVLRVDALAKLGGRPCIHLARDRDPDGSGCAIHEARPRICRGYRCLWLQGGLEADERPDRLGAVIDLSSDGGVPRLLVREATPGALEQSRALAAVAERFRSRGVPVAVSDTRDVLDPERPVRLLLPEGIEQRFAEGRVERWRDGRLESADRLPRLDVWIDRAARAIQLLRWRWIRWRARDPWRAHLDP